MANLKQPEKTIPIAEFALRAMGVDLDALAKEPTPQWVVDLATAAERIGTLAINVGKRVETYLQRQEVQHGRAAVREAFLRRAQWKKSDLAALRTLPGATISQKRLRRLSDSKLGRPVVRTFQPLPVALVGFFRRMQAVASPATRPHVRLQLMKQTPWWAWFVECHYRGCYDEARAQGLRGASNEAEEKAASHLAISPDTLRKLCGQIRKRNRLDCAEPSRAISSTEFEHWKLTGDLPDK